MTLFIQTYRHPLASIDTCVVESESWGRLQVWYPKYKAKKYSNNEYINYHGHMRCASVLSLNVPYEFYSKFATEDSMSIPDDVISDTKRFTDWATKEFGSWFKNIFFQIQGGDIIGCTDEDGFKKLSLAAKLKVPSLPMNLMVVNTDPRVISEENIEAANALCNPYFTFNKDSDAIQGDMELTSDELEIEAIATAKEQTDSDRINEEIKQGLDAIAEDLKAQQ